MSVRPCLLPNVSVLATYTVCTVFQKLYVVGSLGLEPKDMGRDGLVNAPLLHNSQQ